MRQLSDDDLDLVELSDDELELAWDLWFDLAQTTNDDDPPYTHGVFQRARIPGVMRDAPTVPPTQGPESARLD